MLATLTMDLLCFKTNKSNKLLQRDISSVEDTRRLGHMDCCTNRSLSWVRECVSTYSWQLPAADVVATVVKYVDDPPVSTKGQEL